ncbi:MAG: putative baseplate assembly protein [candidate division KSB1 bacterium]|nr:putative baseplate assembly protein [candidate division KSB1 bacterium]MDZ7273981.1 putative baseplate assembly protein [candidate division KSB1 bacterium]MDZ7286354.1 putative baseplate assembly protein [candidate division KSB1 bacterium]MDZ7296582.1 putative baseplate assembly protein [candidate division KSB1 bacterium]MDZ7306115.1 putative baseplate assembly protein [candidate division KSB1 bacterium]
MKPSIRQLLDSRDALQIVKEILARRPGYLPEWEPPEKGADVALLWIFARYLEAILQRLNQAPGKNKLAFLDGVGIDLIPAQAARAPMVFQLSAQASDGRVPAGTRLVSPPPLESTQQIIFETERAAGLAAARITEVISLWPGRDQYINHSADFLAGKSFQPFKKLRLQDTPHIIYLAHNVLLALAGKVNLDVEFELTQLSTEPLDILWEYWDGQIWRGFKAMHPTCMEVRQQKLDGTNGLTRSGRFRLETDCAETAKTAVNGIEAFWIRGRLTEPLPPDPVKVLPEVEAVRLSNVIDQSLKASLTPLVQYVASSSGAARQISGVVINEAGQPLAGVEVRLTSPDDPNFTQVTATTNQNGNYTFPNVAPGKTYEIEIPFSNLLASVRQQFVDNGLDLELNLTLNILGLSPDKAFADAEALDVSKPFHPLGLQPQPGSTFYFHNEEIFNKPGARVRIAIIPTRTPQDDQAITGATLLAHTVSWEYWNGREWLALLIYSNNPSVPTQKSPLDFSKTDVIELQIPPDLEKTTVNDEEARWMRVRLVSGGFGFKQTLTFNSNTFTYVISQPPALVVFPLGYTWQYGPFHPEQVLTYNDFQYEDRTAEASLPGRTFQPFKPVSDVTPALYLGFDKKLPVDRLNLFFDILEQREESQGPALLWEYWNGSSWRNLPVEDETRYLRIPGMVSFIAAEDSQPLARFNASLHWLRARLKEDGPPGEPMVNNIFPNAVWAAQRQTITDEPLGASNGQPNQVFAFRQIPILEGERIEVRELAGARANVEWRMVAMELFGGNARIVQELEDRLGSEGAQTDIEKGDLRLRRDRNKKVTEVWVRWESRRHLFLSGPDDRHYVLERARGRLLFGDGGRGKIPPLGAAILAKQYRSGGGLAGNVAARSITQMQGAIGGLETVFNPSPAEGGADAETLERFSHRGPQTLRHRGRALSARDYETMAKEASPAVAVARAIPTTDANGRKRPGWVTVLIIPQSREPRPQPSFGLREQVRKFIAAHAAADLAAANRIYITGPEYFPIDVQVTIIPLAPAEAGAVEDRARAALENFLHPLHGGPEGNGWELGRDVFLSDVAAVLERVEGVDFVKELTLLWNGAPQGESLKVPEDRIVVAGEIRIKLT